MNRRTLLRVVVGGGIGLAAAPAAALTRKAVARSSESAIHRFDPRLDDLLAADAGVEVVATGYRWLEGPVWRRASAELLFSDIPANTVYAWRPGQGARVFLKPSGYSGAAPFAGREPGSNGLALDRDGRLTLCEHGDRRITRLDDDGRRTVLAARYQGKRLNSPNDLVYRSNGDLYFTDPPFGLPRAFADPAKELDFSGVYRLTPAGELRVVTRALRAPNGIAFSPDERRLYVTDVDPERAAWWVFNLQSDGGLDGGRVFHDARPWMRSHPGGPDGLKVDVRGNLFAAGPGGVYVFAPDASLLGIVETGVATANVAWGEDGRSLFIAADTRVLRLRVTTGGAGFES